MRTSYFKVNSDEISLDEFEELLNQTSNTNIEILNLALDMITLIENNYNKPRSGDEKKFWDIFGKNTFKYEVDGYPLHGKLRSYFAASFLNSNKYLIEDE